MNTVDHLRSELERLFTVEELTTLGRDILGRDDLGATAGTKASLASALVDGSLVTRTMPALDEAVRLLRGDGASAATSGFRFACEGRAMGALRIGRELSSDGGLTTHEGVLSGEACTVRVLHRADPAVGPRLDAWLAVLRFAKVRGVLTTLSIEESDGLVAIAMAPVEGTTVASRVARTGPSHFNEVKAVVTSLVDAVCALHDAGLVHGAVSPESVLIGRSDDGSVLVRLDALGLDRLGSPRVFGAGLRSAAPEVLRGEGSTRAGDVFGVGCVLHVLLTGKSAFEGTTPFDVLVGRSQGIHAKASSVAPKGWVSEALDEFLLKLLATNPADRPADGRALRVALDSLFAGVSVVDKTLSNEEVSHLLATLEAEGEGTASRELERAAEANIEPARIADALTAAAEAASDVDTKKALLFRVARVSDTVLNDLERAMKSLDAIAALDASDEVAESARIEVRRRMKRYDEIVEILLDRSERSSGPEKARAYAEVGRLYAAELDDRDQALVAFATALGEDPMSDEVAGEIEQVAGTDANHWQEALTTLEESSLAAALSPASRAALLLRMARWYDARLGRSDHALVALQKIVSADPANDPAQELTGAIYERAQQWPEFVSTLLARADASIVAGRARDFRVRAAELAGSKLNDTARAVSLLRQVVEEDPGHERACEAYGKLLEAQGDVQALRKLYERRVESLTGPSKVSALLRLADLTAEQLGDVDGAIQHFEMALAVDARCLDALRGLDRIFTRTGRSRELLEVLARQEDLSATPRQKVQVLLRKATLWDEEFVDHEKASDALEAVLAIDPGNDVALTNLSRHCRVLGRWDALVRTLERHAQVSGDESRRIDLLLQRARVLAENIGSPQQAISAYESVLERAAGHAEALEALARLRERAGDAMAALAAIESLAARATTPEARAEQWIRAARVLESRGDFDGAIERFKHALDAIPTHTQAATLLRELHIRRGDFASVVALLEHAISHTDGASARAKLHGELARLYIEQLHDQDAAEAAAKRAYDLDPTATDALFVLGRVAIVTKRFLEAARFHEALLLRLDALSESDAVNVVIGMLEAAAFFMGAEVAPQTQQIRSATGRLVAMPRFDLAIDALGRMNPSDVESCIRLGDALFRLGAYDKAKMRLEIIIRDRADETSVFTRAEVLARIGECERRSGRTEEALARIKEALALEPTRSDALESLAKVHESREAWSDLHAVRAQQLDLSSDTARFDLLVAIGDLRQEKLSDRAGAASAYVQALDLQPDDRRLLAKLMQVYSDERDWAKLVEVVQRLAEGVSDDRQKAKYLYTAAIVSARQLSEPGRAADFFERAIELDPTLDKALREATELRRQIGDHMGRKRLLEKQLDRAKELEDRTMIVSILDELAELYEVQLSDDELAIEAYETAMAFDGEDRRRVEALIALYAKNPKRHAGKAAEVIGRLIARNPYRVEPYRSLRRLYGEAGHVDGAFVLSQALTMLNQAEPEEEELYRNRRSTKPVTLSRALNDETWTERIAHPDLDVVVTKIFALIEPVIVSARAQSLSTLGFDPALAARLEGHGNPLAQALRYGLGVFGIDAPLVFENLDDQGAVGIVAANPPALVVGRAAFDHELQPQLLAFIAGRTLAFMRPGFFARRVASTGTALRAWLLASIRVVVPSFPVALDMDASVDEAFTVLRDSLPTASRARLESLVTRLLQSGRTLDVRRWAQAVDLTADRAAFLLANDLETSIEAVSSVEDIEGVSKKDRIKELFVFSVSEDYLAIRKEFGAAGG